MEFRMLGRVGASIDGREIDCGPSRQLCVLAVLLADPGRTVPVEHLLDRVWGQLPSAAARSTLYSYVTRLRAVLQAGGDSLLVRRSGGYALTIEQEQVDLFRFRRLSSLAHEGDDARAGALLHEALSLWHGDALAGLSGAWAENLRTRLHRERLDALLRYHSIQLRRGNHEEVVTGLSPVAAEHPLDERLAGQLMMALYGCHRQGEALELYERVRGQLREQLGVDPGERLQGIHQQILRADPHLPMRAPSDAEIPTPRQLPAAPRAFVGRADDLAALDHILDNADGGVAVASITGIGGVGKTWLALHWAHRHADAFPDGQLYVDLRGYDSTHEPMQPEVAIRGFLRALGVTHDAIPADVDAQAGLYRSLTAGRRLLIVLDNARDTEHVLPLLPGTATSGVLVTSRSKLVGLSASHRARSVPLDVLTEPEARELLTGHLGRVRMTDHPDAVNALLKHLGGLPLALAIIAARAATDPELSLDALAAELDEATTRLDSLDTGELNADLRAVFASSYRALCDEATLALGLLGLTSLPEVSLPAVAALLGTPAARARAVLRDLQLVHLLQQYAPGRFRMHDLVRLYAAERAAVDIPSDTTRQAMLRLVDHYLHTSHAAINLLQSRRPLTGLDKPAPASAPTPPRNRSAALSWLDTEHAALLIAQNLATYHGWHQRVWHLAWVLHLIDWQRGRLRDSLTSARTALQAAQQLADTGLQADAHRQLGQAHAQLGEHAAALGQLDQALTLFGQAGNLVGQSQTHRIMAIVSDRQAGDQQGALDHSRHCLRLAKAAGNVREHLRALNHVGWYSAQLGDYEQGRIHCEEALELYRNQEDNLDVEGDILDSLGYIAHRRGDHTTALDYYDRALTLLNEVGNVYGVADTLINIGAVHEELGHDAEAAEAWQQALDLCQNQGRHTEATDLRMRLLILQG